VESENRVISILPLSRKRDFSRIKTTLVKSSFQIKSLHRIALENERVRGVARDSNARRRSHLVWAPPHKNFLLKILAPAFDSP
jgi:hypothetical protein